MALSDHERKLLAEMEAALEQEDPRLLSTLTGKARTKQGSRALLGFSIFLVGLFVLVSGLIAKQTIIGVFAFLISLVGVLLVITNISVKTSGIQGKKGKRFGLGSNLEQRWDRRNNNEI
jgi:uncharacterized membrane protein HdeD (DUF308 family)